MRSFSPEEHPAWKPASLGVALAAVAVAALAATWVHSGLWTVWEVVLGLGAGAVGIVVFGLATVAVVQVARRLPVKFLFALGGAIGLLITLHEVVFRWPDVVFYPGLLAFVWLQALLWGAAGALLRGRSRGGYVGSKVLLWIGVVLAVGVQAYGIWWLMQDGSAPDPLAMPDAAVERPRLDAPHPAAVGPYTVQALTYGSGTDRHRPAYQAPQVAWTTPTVDASKLLPAWEGYTARRREQFWGFGPEAFPLNGRVWAPEGEGPFPLVLIVHGNHAMTAFSDDGYAYLGELLASRGFITVSVDENFLNTTWSGDFEGKEMPARAWLLLKHLEQWRTWHADETHPFSGRVDLERIALIGHSRGGEAVALAAAFNRLPAFPDDATVPFDFGFAIESLIALAPTDHRYPRRVDLTDVNYLALQGSYDSDEASFVGIRQYQRVAYVDTTAYRFKAGVYIHRANHAQFNTAWGRTDAGPPRSWLLNLEPLLDPADQRQIAQVYTAAFLETTLHQRYEYLPLFQDPRTGAPWLPQTVLLARFRDSSFRPVADFEEDLDVRTAHLAGSQVEADSVAVWREENLPFRSDETQRNHALVLGVAAAEGRMGEARYEIHLPEAWTDSTLLDTTGQIKETARLTFAVGLGTAADTLSGIPPAIDIEVEDRRGRVVRLPLDAYGGVPPIVSVQHLKLASVSRQVFGDSTEPVLRTVGIPLLDFSADSRLDPRVLRHIRFYLRAGPGVRFYLDDIGFIAPPPVEEPVVVPEPDA